MERKIEALRKLLEASERVVIFTGAGISTESGIPDFRSPQGIWSQMQPIQFQDFLTSEEMRRESWRRKSIIDKDIDRALPNRGHRAVSALVTSGKCRTVITQNIDGLHQASGIPEANIVELHGNGTYAACLDCGTRYELAPILDAFKADESLPICTRCNGIIKTATISFGQAMPEDAMARAAEAAQTCDLFIVLGSSLVVYPAAGFPGVAQRSGASLVIINREATDQDDGADLVLHDEIGAMLGLATRVD
ncbi:MAG: SIR2 family NAD-dependent protein deacylase [Gammaproteobacteria bacterium]|jgi:NAD-dependent deacetylase